MTKDVGIVGAGPVGLHAALKAALLNMSAVVEAGPELLRRNEGHLSVSHRQLLRSQ
jgi:thioredoxin reductase